MQWLWILMAMSTRECYFGLLSRCLLCFVKCCMLWILMVLFFFLLMFTFIFRWGFGGYGRCVIWINLHLVTCNSTNWIPFLALLLFILLSVSISHSSSNFSIFVDFLDVLIRRLGHREQKDEWAPRRVDVFQRKNTLPPDAIISAGSVNSSCTAGTTS